MTVGTAVEFKSHGAQITVPNGWTSSDMNIDKSRRNDENVETFKKKIAMVAFALTLRDTHLFFPNQSHSQTAKNGWLFSIIISISFEQQHVINMEDNWVNITFPQPKNVLRKQKYFDIFLKKTILGEHDDHLRILVSHKQILGERWLPCRSKALPG